MANEFKARNGVITPYLQSTVATGTQPIVVSSTTLVSNLNVQYHNGKLSTDFGLVASGLNQFAATTSSDLASIISDATGSGSLVFASSPSLVSPALGTPSGGVLTNCTGIASGLTSGTVLTNANLTGEVTSVGNATTVTNAAVMGKVLTGYVSGAGTISASDTILQAIQKLNGNISASSGVSSVSVVSTNGFTGTSSGGSTPAITLTTSVIGVLKGNGTAISAASQADITGLLGAGSISNTMLANAAVANLSGTNTGDQTTITGNAGTATKLATARTIATSGDVTGTATSFDGSAIISIPTIVTKINGTALSTLATGILKNTTTTGVPVIAVAGTDYQSPIGTISGIAKGNGANALIAATAGTDYQSPIGTISGIAKGNGANALIAATAGTDYTTPTGSESLTNKTITAVAVKETRVVVAASAIDLATGNYFTKTATGALSWTVSNVPAAGIAASFILDLTNGGTGAQTWITGTKWASGTAPTLTAAGRDVLGFFTHDGGTTWNGLLLGKGMA